MPSWTQVLEELQSCKRVDALDFVRRNYLKEFSDSIGRNIIASLNNHEDTETHSQHLPTEDAKNLGLKIMSTEDHFDGGFQDQRLSVYHAYMYTLSNSPAIKIVENQYGTAEGALLMA